MNKIISFLMSLCLGFLISGCTSSVSKDEFSLLEKWVFEDYVLRDGFPSKRETIPENLVKYAEVNYDNNPKVRALLIIDFLKYDNQALKNGDVTSTGCELVTVLYDKEIGREFNGRAELLFFMDKKKEKYCLDKYYGGVGLKLLTENRKLFEALARTWDKES